MTNSRCLNSPSLVSGLLLLILVASSGCSAVGITTSLVASREIDRPEMTPSTTPVATYTVEIHSDSQRPQRAELPLTEQTSVDAVLEKVKAKKKFKRMHISVARKVEGQYEPVKMKSHYDPKKRQVTIATDYALHPGDRIIITEDATSLIDDMVGSLLGPLGR